MKVLAIICHPDDMELTCGGTLIKFKKAYLTHVSFLVGTILGAVWMFSNTAYHSVATGEDTYRTTAFDIEGFFAQSRRNLKVIVYNLFTNNVGICIVAVILLAVLVIAYNKNNSNNYYMSYIFFWYIYTKTK